MKKEASRNKLQKSAGELAGPDQKLELGMAMVRALPPFLRRDTAQKLVGERGYRTLRQILAPLEPMPKEESCKLVVIADSLIDKWAEEWERHYHD